MQIYTRVLLKEITSRFLFVFAITLFLMLTLLLGLGRSLAIVDALPWSFLMHFMAYEMMHALCWTLPCALYVSLLLWTADAIESQLIYRLFHSGWTIARIYRVQCWSILPLLVLACLINALGLPWARIQQRLLLESAYRQDVHAGLSSNRFHSISLGGEPWVLYLDRQHGRSHVVGFQSEGEKWRVVSAQEVSAKAQDGRIHLREGQRVDFHPGRTYPLIVVDFKDYALSIPGLQELMEHELPDYQVDVWDRPTQAARFEAYNRFSRMAMLGVLSIFPARMMVGSSIHKMRFFLQGLSLYMLYWFFFLLGRWILIWDQFQHLSWLLFPHACMLFLAAIWPWLRRVGS